MYLLAFLNNLSDQQVKVYVNENLLAKSYVGLGFDQKASNLSTLTVLRNRPIKQGNFAVFEALLAETVPIALTSSIRFGSLQVIVNVHIVANVNKANEIGLND